MGLQDHVHVIGSVSDRESDFGGVAVLDHVHNVCLLFGRDSTGKHYVHVVTNL
jgi:hypothetical protein